MTKIRWWDWFVYKMFYWRWAKIFRDRPDLREFMISYLKAYDVLDEGDKIIVKVIIERKE